MSTCTHFGNEWIPTKPSACPFCAPPRVKEIARKATEDVLNIACRDEYGYRLSQPEVDDALQIVTEALEEAMRVALRVAKPSMLDDRFPLGHRLIATPCWCGQSDEAHEPKRNHKACCFSTGIDGSITAGTGELDANGYWEHPCEECTRQGNRMYDSAIAKTLKQRVRLQGEEP